MIAGEGATPKPGSLDNGFVTSNKDWDTRHGDYDGDLMPSDPGAIPGVGGGQGPLGRSVDGISCDSTMSNNYHVHAFVGLYYDGQIVVIPDAIGIFLAAGDMTDPNSPYWPNQELEAGTSSTPGCFYHIHTHDDTGMVHLEDPDPSGTPITQSLFTVGNLLDIWGVDVTASQFGPFNGLVSVYTSGQTYRGGCAGVQATPWQCQVGDGEYTQWSGDPHNIPLYSHEVVWFEVGTNNPDAQHLPGVSFATEY